jgi:hypothetical protein
MIPKLILSRRWRSSAQPVRRASSTPDRSARIDLLRRC